MTAPDTTREAAKAKTFARKVLAGITSQVKKSYEALKARYGPRYTKAMVGAAFVAVFSPLPGSVPVVIAVLVAVAEVHRAIAKRGRLLKFMAEYLACSATSAFFLLWVVRIGATTGEYSPKPVRLTGIIAVLSEPASNAEPSPSGL